MERLISQMAQLFLPGETSLNIEPWGKGHINDSGELPVRIVHNDTKINNLMYKNGRVRAVVDLDTTGPGSVLFDFGDAIRTIANNSAEDEQNTNSVGFNKEFFRAFTAGYLQETNI